jgi:uncharacterized membrane protein YidH (DUF202 family)
MASTRMTCVGASVTSIRLSVSLLCLGNSGAATSEFTQVNAVQWRGEVLATRSANFMISIGLFILVYIVLGHILCSVRLARNYAYALWYELVSKIETGKLIMKQVIKS